MAKIAVLLPRESMLEQARKVIEEEKMDIPILKVIKTADSVYEARNAVENGAGIIVARGVQASYIKTYTDIPIAEIEISGQELGLLVKRAKQALGKEHPSIAVIGYRNMYSDMSYFDEIFDITLKPYFFDAIEEAEEAVGRAISEGTELIIGGDVVNELARQKGIPALFLESTEDSIRNALKVAQRMSYTAETERSHIAQFQTLLDTSYNGIIKISSDKEITIVNRPAEMLLEKDADILEGRNICEVVPELSESLLDSVLSGRRDTASTTVRLGETPVMITAGPIRAEEEITGAILSCQRLSGTPKIDADQSRLMYLRGYRAGAHFTDPEMSGPQMRQCVEQGRIFALSSNPILIYGESGTGKEIFAQCIHNNSAYKGGPFVNVNLGGMTEEMQMERLFGNPRAEDETLKKGALSISDMGTLLISEVENLTPVAQYRLYRALRYKSLIQNDLERSQTLNNRIIATSLGNLAERVEDGLFREDLYYLLNSLVIEIPPLRERKKDIERIVNRARKRFAEKYSRFLRIPEDTMEVLRTYEWPGNEIQLDAFLERLFLTSPKKTVGEAYVRSLLEELYPRKLRDENGQEVIYRDPEAMRLAELLEKYHGSRSRAAQELGISTTTLWRRMKKLGVTG